MAISDSKKESNKKYYAQKKAQIAEKLYKKEECSRCGRVVSHQNINKHQKSRLCMSRSEKPKIDMLMEKVSSLETILKNMKIAKEYDDSQNGYDGFTASE